MLKYYLLHQKSDKMIKLNEIEREIWIKFHEFAYKDDLELSRKIKESNPRYKYFRGDNKC